MNESFGAVTCIGLVSARAAPLPSTYRRTCSGSVKLYTLPMPLSPELPDAAPRQKATTRQKATIYLTAADLANDPGPLTTVRYAVVLALGPEVFRWIYADATTADAVNVIGTNDTGAPGRWHRTRHVVRGADLTTGAQTITVAQKPWRVIPAATILGNSVITIDDAGAVEGDEVLVTRNGTEAFTVTIANGGTGGGNIAVMPVSVRSWALSAFNGTDWVHKASGLSLAAA